MIDINLKFGTRLVDLPYSVRLYGVTEEMFDELTDEDTKAELLDGMMIMHSPATAWHDNVDGFLRMLMSIFADEKGFGLVLGPDTIVRLQSGRKFAPDIFIFRWERVPSPLPKQFEGAPDLVVEVLSPSNRNDDLNDKRRAYREAGVGEIWFVDGENRQILVDRKQAEGYSEEVATAGRVPSTVLEGFWIEADWLWMDLLPNRLACVQAILGT